VVISLSIGPSVCFGKILKPSDKICCGNGILALGTKEFWNFVLLDPEVEIGRSITTWRRSCGGRASGVARVVIVPVEIHIGIIIVVVVLIILQSQVDIVTYSSGHLV
jgi:hypothetical protein